ncbi:MAG: DUF3793 family protein [Lachnospiraceae bacterium]|nr:DUF3793 family protein [Lachnospiraceae bacterium]
MSCGLSQMIQNMDRNNIELRIAYQCAPLLAGLKPSNLLMLRAKELKQVQYLLKQAGIKYFIVAHGQGRAAVLLYNKASLQEYLEQAIVAEKLGKMGYTDLRLGKVLYVFRQHYEAFLRGEISFPHEMGFLLGYPVEDVEGFIRNEGENSLYTGDWKVYGNLSEKLRLFGKFETARERLMKMVSAGVGIADIAKQYKMHQPVA